jgi:hypothetical protein
MVLLTRPEVSYPCPPTCTKCCRSCRWIYCEIHYWYVKNLPMHNQLICCNTVSEETETTFEFCFVARLCLDICWKLCGALLIVWVVSRLLFISEVDHYPMTVTGADLILPYCYLPYMRFSYKRTQERSKRSSPLFAPQPGYCDDVEYSEHTLRRKPRYCGLHAREEFCESSISY